MDTSSDGVPSASASPPPLKRRRIETNIHYRLMQRENNLNRRWPTNRVNQEFYKNVYPNLTIANVQKPPGYLRKFTPNGKFLISFSYDQTALEVYEFRGSAKAATMLYPWKDEFMPNITRGNAHDIRTNIFDALFKLRHSINISPLNKQLNRECSVFTDDCRYVIVVGASAIPEESRPSFYDIYTSNETLSPLNIEDYTIYLVDYVKGTVSDSINLTSDKLYLSHNQGIYLYKNTFAFLSVFHQSIHIYGLVDGKFVVQHQIGRFCSEFEEEMYNAVYPHPTHRPLREVTINSLKHRLLVFLYRMAADEVNPGKRRLEIRRFFQRFDYNKNLRLWKMQIIDEDNLLLKYATEDMVTLKIPEPNSFSSYFVFYNISESKVLFVYDNTSKILLSAYEKFADSFRNSQIQSEIVLPCSPSNSYYANLCHQRCKNVLSARNGDSSVLTARMVALLPISSQSYSSSPYLDLDLYSYDDRWISVIERPKNCSEYPIVFFDRETGILKFRLFPAIPGNSPNTSKSLVAFIFHPTEPFAISVQRLRYGYIVNFHIRNQATTIR